LSIHDVLFLPVALAMRHVGQAITEPVRLSGAFGTQVKSDNTLVTVADTQAQDYLLQALPKIVAGAKVLGEESFGKGQKWQDSPLVCDQSSVFVVDPIDGTRRFARGEDYGVMVALRQQGQVRAAWIYYPVTDDMIFASEQDESMFIHWSADSKMPGNEMIVLKVGEGLIAD
jgi:fructose-1,6-bisphosphatase/inositol monophosphatase family enzyme